MQRARLVPDVLKAFDAKMRCADHGQMLTTLALEGDVLTGEVCCADVIADVQKALAILVRKATNAS